jgi:hypothetical protein
VGQRYLRHGEIVSLAKKWIRKTFSHTLIPDESVFQTLCWNSPFRDCLFYPTGGQRGNMRLAGWRKKGLLEDWTMVDVGTLRTSGALFARKFNSKDKTFLKIISTLAIEDDKG